MMCWSAAMVPTPSLAVTVTTLLTGGWGKDFLTTGQGNDKVVFDFTFLPSSGIDVVTDFAAGVDKLILSGTRFHRPELGWAGPWMPAPVRLGRRHEGSPGGPMSGCSTTPRPAISILMPTAMAPGPAPILVTLASNCPPTHGHQGISA